MTPLPGPPSETALHEMSVVRIKLGPEQPAPQPDVLGRTMIGFADGLDANELWRRGRGVWKANLDILKECDLALIVFDDVVRMVGTVDGVTFHSGRCAIEGSPDPGHPLIGAPDPVANRSRNPIAYGWLRTVRAAPAARPYNEVFADAVSVLTEASRLRRPTGSRALSGSGPREESIDWAEFVSLALAGAAANAGGIEAALSGRPGSWEADLVRSMLTSTVGEGDADLLRHRTEPLRVRLWPDEWLDDLGYPAVYAASREWVAEQQREHQWQYRLTTDRAKGEHGLWAPLDESAPPFEEPEGPERGESWNWPAPAGQILSVARSARDGEALEQIAAIEAATEDLEHGDDPAAYAEALHATASQIAAEMYPGHDIVVEIHRGISSYPWDDDASNPERFVADAARTHTPLPWSGLTPADYAEAGHDRLVDLEREAGRLPHQRAAKCAR